MPKRQSKNKTAPQVPQSLNITQSVNIGDQWDSKAFATLLKEQAQSNETAIKQLETAMGAAAANQQQLAEQIAQTSMMKDIKEALIAQLEDRKFERLKQDQIKLKEQEKIKLKAANDQLKENLILRREEAKAIANIAKGMQTFRTVGDRFSDMGRKLKDSFGSMSALKMTALKTFNIGGIFNKSIAKEQFIQTQRKLGSQDDRKTLASNFESANKSAKDIKRNEEELSRFKKETGLSESELAKTKEGKRLLGQREKLSQEYSKYDLKAGLVKQETPSQKFADSGAGEEAMLENQKNQEKQAEVLKKIEENTNPEKVKIGRAHPSKVKEEEKGGGLLSGLLGGGGAGKALKSLKDFGIGIVFVAAGLFVASKAFQSFAEVEWESVGKGLLALGGLVLAALALDKAKGSIIKGAAVLGILALATWGIGEALKTFSDLDWETIGKGFAAIAGLGIIGAIAGAAAGPITLGAIALGLLGGAVWVIGEAFQAVGKGFQDLTDGIERLGQLDGDNLLNVAKGIGALGLAMAAFGGGQAAGGLLNLVGGFLGAITPGGSPIDQLQKIADMGGKLGEASDGIGKIGDAMKKFSAIDKKSMEAINDFPWIRATAFVAAGGAMSVDGAAVYNKSKSNADQSAQNAAQSGGSTTVVNAPVNQKQTTVLSSRRPLYDRDTMVSNDYWSRRTATRLAM